MATVLFVSLTLLVLTFGVRHYELARGGGRAFELTRTRLDRSTIKTQRRIQDGFQHVLEYTRRDVFLNGLHMVTYLALLIVRFVESKLERGTIFLRSFRKQTGVRKASKKLRTIRRENPVHSESEQR
jgi:hypothetical protein